MIAPKAGNDPEYSESYRPICVPSNISKVVESDMLSRLHDSVMVVDPIRDFHAGHCTKFGLYIHVVGSRREWTLL